mmetsp:Transcript_23207/g.33304  ORF Transcript_23207/g.33304 Transcript_23207/m.33304 type:complete len:90 (+) Transcript_23207:378-647(+)
MPIEITDYTIDGSRGMNTCSGTCRSWLHQEITALKQIVAIGQFSNLMNIDFACPRFNQQSWDTLAQNETLRHPTTSLPEDMTMATPFIL